MNELDLDFLENLGKKTDTKPSESKKEELDIDLLEPTGKKNIIVKYDNEDHFVSWYEDDNPKDILDAIVCACDCIQENGFELLDEKGEQVDLTNISSIKNGFVYYLFKGNQIDQFKTILGDNWRKLKV